MCGARHQACLDALPNGNQGRFRRGCNQRLTVCGGNVQSQWHRRYSRVMPEPIFETGFRSHPDASDVPHNRFSHGQQECVNQSQGSTQSGTLARASIPRMPKELLPMLIEVANYRKENNYAQNLAHSDCGRSATRSTEPKGITCNKIPTGGHMRSS